MEFLLRGVTAITWQQLVMYAIGGLLIYLAIEKGFEPALLMQGSTTEIATAFASALIGVIGIASGMQNWLLVRCRLRERALLLASGLMLIFPGLITDTIGLSSLLIVLFAQRLRKGGSPIAAA